MIPPRVVVFQTAFLGDALLTIPLATALRRVAPGTSIAMVTTPAAADLLEGQADIERVIVYDKHGRDRGIRGAVRVVQTLRRWDAGLALVPHRSIRSALIVRSAGIRRRIGFTTSAGSFLFTDKVVYRRSAHEIDRNLDLLLPLGVRPAERVMPALSVNVEDAKFVDHLILERFGSRVDGLVAVAPGSVWATKRWLPQGFAEVCKTFVRRGMQVAIIGGVSDRQLCESIARDAGTGVISFAGELTLMRSAGLLRRSKVVLTNDSAPGHIAMAVGTPVVTIFGPTVPSFGFPPIGPRDSVVEDLGLSCRPCSIHGGKVCPIGTFDCMKHVTSERVIAAMDVIMNGEHHGA